MSLALSSLRVGKKYRLTNLGEVAEFQILETIGRSDFYVKDIHTLELFNLSDLTKFGKGTDYSLWEIGSA
ncbi:MAG: hypothetical protein RJQ09_15510 [Cyclobacteriaceae bacterium]